jgi:hypothetical protein
MLPHSVTTHQHIYQPAVKASGTSGHLKQPTRNTQVDVSLSRGLDIHDTRDQSDCAIHLPRLHDANSPRSQEVANYMLSGLATPWPTDLFSARLRVLNRLISQMCCG